MGAARHNKHRILVHAAIDTELPGTQVAQLGHICQRDHAGAEALEAGLASIACEPHVMALGSLWPSISSV